MKTLCVFSTGIDFSHLVGFIIMTMIKVHKKKKRITRQARPRRIPKRVGTRLVFKHGPKSCAQNFNPRLPVYVTMQLTENTMFIFFFSPRVKLPSRNFVGVHFLSRGDSKNEKKKDEETRTELISVFGHLHFPVSGPRNTANSVISIS